jgi:hypothetical protein
MGRKRKSALSEEKRNIIGQLLEVYDIKTAADVQEALKDLLGGTLQSMLAPTKKTPVSRAGMENQRLSPLKKGKKLKVKKLLTAKTSTANTASVTP